MKKFKKSVAMGLTAVLAMTGVVGCGSQEKAVDVAKGTEETATSSSDAKEKVAIKWYFAGPGPQADVKTVQTAINDYLLSAHNLNVDIQLMASDYGSYSEKMQMVISSGEEFDICWTANWNNNYYNNVNKNAFIELDDLLGTHAPELKGQLPDTIWDATKVNGHIYGVPNEQIFTLKNYVNVVKEQADKYSLDIDSVHSLQDLDGFFTSVKQDNPNIYPFAAAQTGVLSKTTLSVGYDELAGRHIPGVIKLDDDTLTVVNQFELPEVMDRYKLMYKWSQEGIIRQDAATVAENAVPEMKAGKHIASVNATFKPGIEVTEMANFGGKEVVFGMLSDAWLTTGAITSSINAISRTSKNPEIAMQLLNLINTDAEFYNLFCFGVEGVHYNKNADGTVKVIEDAGYNPNTDWMFGNQFNGYLREGQASDTWEQTKAINDSAKASPALGFSFNSTPVTTEIASVSAIIDQYQLSLDTGVVDPEVVLPEMNEKLKAAGSEKIIAEVQSQLDAWKATK